MNDDHETYFDPRNGGATFREFLSHIVQGMIESDTNYAEFEIQGLEMGKPMVLTFQVTKQEIKATQ